MFTGFTPETFDFLWGIRLNNNRDWFLLHKEQYQKTLYEPMKELGQELFAPFLSKGAGDLLKVSRIYRDARMHPPEPYKESLWLCIRQDVPWWAQHPCLFFEITPEGASWGFFLFKPTVMYMQQFRSRIAAQPEPFLEMVARLKEATGMELTAQCYKRPKETDNPALAPYFAWKEQLGCIVSQAPGPELFRPELKDQVQQLFGHLEPVYRYFNQFQP